MSHVSPNLFHFLSLKLGLPEVNEGKTKLSWIDQVDITNSPILLENPKQLVDELQLTFTSKAKEIMGRGAEKGEREDSV